ncbi:hypothetical protein [Streptomyces sp. SDr-06]|uniref:hypothetical protein n=1 Tax=Streptomyces sp. SDr-06 TaxID=2267702 RepID=UPI001CB8D9F0|nr:hypothetical protein [Streptomyces sp. SDr-06]
MTTPSITPPLADHMAPAEHIHADHMAVKHIGEWTTSGRFEIRARSGFVVLDLRSKALPEEIDIRLYVRRTTVKLLVDDAAVIDHWDLKWTGRGKVKDAQGPSPSHDGSANRRITLLGCIDSGEIRINRGGIATLVALTDRAHRQEMRRTHEIAEGKNGQKGRRS